MSRLRPLPLLLVAALAALPAVADARRAPTRRERAGVAHAARIPARCLATRISTVNRRYAAVHVRNGKRSCRRWAADGVAAYKRHGTRWRFVTAGSAFECPVPKVPRRVAKDLRIRCYSARGR